MPNRPEYLTFTEVQERLGCTENDLRRWILGRHIVASYFFAEETAKVVERFNRVDLGVRAIWVPELKKREERDENSTSQPFESVWVDGFYYLVYPDQREPLAGSFYLLALDRDFSEEVGGVCYMYRTKSNPFGLSMDDVVRNGVLMASEVERLRQLLVGSADQNPGTFEKVPTTHAEKQAAAKDAFKKHDGNKTHAADELGISRRTFDRWRGTEAEKRAARGGNSTERIDKLLAPKR